MANEMADVIDECRNAFNDNTDISYGTARIILRWYVASADPMDKNILGVVNKHRTQARTSDARLCLEMLWRWVYRNGTK